MEGQDNHRKPARTGPTSGSIDLEYAVPTKKQRGNFFCEVCDLSFTSKRALSRHQKQNKQHLAKINVSYEPAHKCTSCSHAFAREHDLRRHYSERHQFRRRTNGMQSFATIFRHRSDEEVPHSVVSSLVSESLPMDFMFNGPGEESIPLPHKRAVEEDEPPPEIAPPQPATFRSRRAEPGESMAFRRTMSQYQTPDPQPFHTLRHNTLASPTNELEHFVKPGLDRALSEPLQAIGESDMEGLDGWLNESFSHYFEQVNDEYKLLNGATNKATQARHVALCPVCRAPHEDITMLLRCMSKHFEKPLRSHVCNECQFGFVHADHLKLHHASIKKHSHCGFHFPHQCHGHHPPDEPNPGHIDGTHDSLHDRMEAWYLMTLFFKARQLITKLDGQAAASQADRRWTLAALRTKYRSMSVVTALNVRAPTMPTESTDAKPERHSWHLPAALEETFEKVTRRLRSLSIPHVTHERDDEDMAP